MTNYYESRGLAVNRRKLPFVARLDIIGLGGEYQEYAFEHEIFDHWESESFVRVMLGDEEIKRSSIHNDFYGFLTCYHDPIKWSGEYWEKYKGKADVQVVTKLTCNPAVFDTRKNRKQFYQCSFSYTGVPRHWVGRKDLNHSALEYIIWKNGGATQGFLDLKKKAVSLAQRDDAGANRFDPMKKWSIDKFNDLTPPHNKRGE